MWTPLFWLLLFYQIAYADSPTQEQYDSAKQTVNSLARNPIKTKDEFEKTLPKLNQTYELFQDALSDDRFDKTVTLFYTANTIRTIAILQEKFQDVKNALKNYRVTVGWLKQIVDHLEQNKNPDKERFEALLRLANTKRLFAKLYRSTGDLSASKQELEEAFKNLKAAERLEPTYDSPREADQATMKSELAFIDIKRGYAISLRMLGQYNEAETALKEALALTEESPNKGKFSRHRLSLTISLASTLTLRNNADKRDHEKARTLYEEAAEEYGRQNNVAGQVNAKHGLADLDLQRATIELAKTSPNYELIESFLKSASKALDSAESTNTSDRQSDRLRLATTFQKQGDIAYAYVAIAENLEETNRSTFRHRYLVRAESAYSKAQEQFQETLGEGFKDHNSKAELCLQLGNLYTAWGSFEKDPAYHKKAIAEYANGLAIRDREIIRLYPNSPITYNQSLLKIRNEIYERLVVLITKIENPNEAYKTRLLIASLGRKLLDDNGFKLEQRDKVNPSELNRALGNTWGALISVHRHRVWKRPLVPGKYHYTVLVHTPAATEIHKLGESASVDIMNDNDFFSKVWTPIRKSFGPDYQKLIYISLAQSNGSPFSKSRLDKLKFASSVTYKGRTFKRELRLGQRYRFQEVRSARNILGTVNGEKSDE